MNKFLIIILTVALLTTVLPLAAGAAKVNEMNDVSSGQWYYNAVNYCLEKEYMRGVGIDRFMPEGIVTRAQMAQTLFNRAEDNSVDMERNKFTDVPLSQWYAPPIIWCQQQNVINGTSATTFSPNANVTREQVCVMVYNFYKGYLGEKPELADLSTMGKYTDWPSVSTWAREAVRWAVHTKFMSGKSATMLAPNGQATRAELAQFLLNFDKVLEGTGGTEPTPPPVPTHPYTASTLARAELRYSYADLLMTLDGDENLVYYDNNSRTLYRIDTDAVQENRRETLLNATEATCTVPIDGSNVTYKDLDVTQVFYDDVQDRLILQGKFSSIDTSANGGWGNPDAPDKYSGAFTLENGRLELLMPYPHAQFKVVFLCAMSDGKYLISNQTNYVNHGGNVQIWDPYTDTFTTLLRSDSTPKPYRYAVQDGQDIYAVSVDDESFFTHIHKYDFTTRKWEDTGTAHCRFIASRDGLFYGWDYDGRAVAIRPTGEVKILYDVSQDVLVTDLTALPDSPKNLLVTSSGMFIFYDDDARAIRAVYRDASLWACHSTPSRRTRLRFAAPVMMASSGTWGVFSMRRVVRFS